jgi:hypothetical protein
MTVAVTGPTGSGVAGASIHLGSTATSFALLGVTATGTESSDETTDATGGALLEMLPATSASLTVTPPAGSGLAPVTVAFTPGDGSTLPVHLSLPASRPSTTKLTSSASPAVFGQSVTLTATLAPASGTGVPSGSVRFFNGKKALGSAVALDNSGQATLAVGTLTLGSHAITAVYSGDATFNVSRSKILRQRVVKDGTSVGLAATPNPSAVGSRVTLTATVTAAAPGSGSPTGMVQFYDGTKKLGAPVALKHGNAIVKTTKLAKGSHSISAVYKGNASFTASASATLTQTVS